MFGHIIVVILKIGYVDYLVLPIFCSAAAGGKLF